jgi:DNA-binding response OmpR family regulator
VCEEIRRRDRELPIVMLTAKGEEMDKVRGLKLGADDYVTKPFGVNELLARIEAALRRNRQRRKELATVSFGIVRADFVAHRLEREGVAQEVTAHEMKLLAYFLEHEGMLLTRQQILDAVWGADYFGTERTVDNFINRLRAKIERDPREPRHLVTVRGGGYRFERSVTER